MLRFLALRVLAAQERALGESLEYTRHILAVAPRAFLRLALFSPLASHRHRAPQDALAVARLVATQHEDCGTCVQIEVNLARKAKVSKELLQAVLEGRPDALPPTLVDTFHFAKEVVSASGQDAAFRERLVVALGPEAVVELSLAIASSRVYPTIKRALGYATSCKKVVVRF